MQLQLQVPSGLGNISVPEMRPRGRQHGFLPLLLPGSWPFLVLPGSGPGQGPAFRGSVCTDMSASWQHGHLAREMPGAVLVGWARFPGPWEGNSSGQGEEKPVGGGTSRMSRTGEGEAGAPEL